MKKLSVPTPLFFVFFFFLHFHITTGTVASTPRYEPVENILLNCGTTSDNLKARDGRDWMGDEGSKFGPIEEPGSHESNTANAPLKIKSGMDDIPYMTARISKSSFTYTFPVTPGPKFVRLYFYPVSYPGFDRSKAFFTVKAGSFTLRKNFSTSLYVDSWNITYFFQEFCIPVQENQKLNLTFTPIPPSGSGDSYAFINGIEIVSMPTNLYYSIPEGEGVPYIGRNSMFNIDYNMALETMLRMNVGGGYIQQTEDTGGMFREWPGFMNDYMYGRDIILNPRQPDMTLSYTKIKNYTASDDVYRSALTAGPNMTENLLSNMTWEIPIDQGFSYLVRLHFCEIVPKVTSEGQRQFLVYIDNHEAEKRADIFMWTKGRGIPVYREYVVTIENKPYLVIQLHPVNVGYVSAILNGMEVFKLSKISDGNLATPNPPELHQPPPDQQPAASTTKKSTKKTVFIAVGAGTGFLVLLSLACCMVLWKLGKTKCWSWCWCWPDPYRRKSARTKASSLPNNGEDSSGVFQGKASSLPNNGEDSSGVFQGIR